MIADKESNARLESGSESLYHDAFWILRKIAPEYSHLRSVKDKIKGADTGARNKTPSISNSKEFDVGIVDQNDKYHLIIEAKPPKVIKGIFPKTQPNIKKYKSSFVEQVRKNHFEMSRFVNHNNHVSEPLRKRKNHLVDYTHYPGDSYLWGQMISYTLWCGATQYTVASDTNTCIVAKIEPTLHNADKKVKNALKDGSRCGVIVTLYPLHILTSLKPQEIDDYVCPQYIKKHKSDDPVRWQSDEYEKLKKIENPLAVVIGTLIKLNLENTATRGKKYHVDQKIFQQKLKKIAKKVVKNTVKTKKTVKKNKKDLEKTQKKQHQIREKLRMNVRSPLKTRKKNTIKTSNKIIKTQPVKTSSSKAETQKFCKNFLKSKRYRGRRSKK